MLYYKSENSSINPGEAIRGFVTPESLTKLYYLKYPGRWRHTSGIDEVHWHEPYRLWVCYSRILATVLCLCAIQNTTVLDTIGFGVVLYLMDLVTSWSHTKQRDHLSILLLSWMAGWVLANNSYFTHVMMCVTWARICSMDEVIYCAREHTAPKSLKLVRGGTYGPSHNRTMLDPRVCHQNLCGWELMFEDPRGAQRALATRRDGKMTASQINHFACMGLVDVYTPRGRHRYGAPHGYTNGRIMFIENEHARRYIPTGRDDDVYENYDGGPVGIIYPQAVQFKHRPFAQLQEMEERVALVWTRVAKTTMGMMAEAAYIAGKIELDIFYELAMRPHPDSLTPTKLARAFLTNPKRKVYDRFNNAWLWKSGQALITNSDTYVHSDSLPEMIGASCMVWTGACVCHCTWANGRPSQFIDDDGVKVDVGRWIVIVEDLPYRKGKVYLNRFDEIYEKNDVHNPDAGLKSGIPACGKSYDIVQTLDQYTIALGPTKESVANLVERGVEAYTIDSILVNGYTGTTLIKTVKIDEGLLEHCGAMLMAVQLLRPDYVQIYGDTRQIHFIPRLPGYVPVNDEYPYNTEEEPMTNSYNNPQVVCNLLRPLYGAYNWCNKVVGRLMLRMINSIENLPPGHAVYLTFTQIDKYMVSKALPGEVVYTIHEAQGKRWSDVALVRLSIFKVPVYKSVSHNIVAVSRTSDRFTYYTVDGGDMMSSWLKRGEANEPEDELEAKQLFDAKVYEHRCYSTALSWDKVVKINEVEVDELYDTWMSMVKQVDERFIPEALAFTTRMPLRRHLPWIDHPGPMHCVAGLQVIYDGLFRRRDPDISRVQRYDYPTKLPDGMSADLIKSSRRPAMIPRPALTNLLKTTQPDRAMDHGIDVVRAFAHRVMDVPIVKEDYDPKMVETLCTCVLDHLDLKKLESLNSSVPLENREMHKLWWMTRPSAKRKAVVTATLLRAGDGTYFCIVRGDHKAKLDNTHPDGVPPGQLVTAMSPFWNAFFAPIFQTMLVKLLAVLPPHIIFCTRMTEEQKNTLISEFLSGISFKVLEGDIEKYDKSQEYVFLMAQCKLFKHFGMSDWQIDLWQTFHELCTLTNPKWGFRTSVPYQRRSGDPLTWFGNTLVLFMIMAYLYDLKKCRLVLLNGDDNLLVWPPDYDIPERSKLAAAKLNFSMKTFSLSTTMYFSSRFIIPTRFGFLSVGDPVKLATRLGRSDLQGHEHLHAIRDSWKSLHYMYQDIEVRTKLDSAAVARYNGILGTNLVTLMPLIESISAILQDYSNLESLYSGTDYEWNLTLDPGEKVGGGLYEKIVDVYVTDI